MSLLHIAFYFSSLPLFIPEFPILVLTKLYYFLFFPKVLSLHYYTISNLRVGLLLSLKCWILRLPLHLPILSLFLFFNFLLPFFSFVFHWICRLKITRHCHSNQFLVFLLAIKKTGQGNFPDLLIIWWWLLKRITWYWLQLIFSFEYVLCFLVYTIVDRKGFPIYASSNFQFSNWLIYLCLFLLLSSNFICVLSRNHYSCIFFVSIIYRNNSKCIFSEQKSKRILV